MALVTCVVRVKGSKILVKVCFEQSGPIVGTEVSNLEQYGEVLGVGCKDKNTYITDGEMILLYGDSYKSKVLFCVQ